ncbi:HTH-type transcriptional regulator DmlR [compost metagenome]
MVHRKRVCASPDYLAERGCPQSTSDLSSHSILLYRRADRVNIWQLPDATGRIADMPLSSRLQLDDLEAIADAATAGLGLAWLPEWLVRERLRTGALVSVLDDQPGAVMECYALWPAASHMPLRLRLAVDALVKQLPEVMGAQIEHT